MLQYIPQVPRCFSLCCRYKASTRTIMAVVHYFIWWPTGMRCPKWFGISYIIRFNGTLAVFFGRHSPWFSIVWRYLYSLMCHLPLEPNVAWRINKSSLSRSLRVKIATISISIPWFLVSHVLATGCKTASNCYWLNVNTLSWRRLFRPGKISLSSFHLRWMNLWIFIPKFRVLIFGQCIIWQS